MSETQTTICHFNAGKQAIRLEDILKRVSEEDILAYYFHIYRVPALVNSPLREDHNPSFSIYINPNGKLIGYDFGIKTSYGLFDMLMQYFHMGFSDVLNMIWKDMCQITTKQSQNNVVRTYLHKHENIKLEVKTRVFKDYDLAFWNSFGINKQWLRFGRVFAISDIIKKSDNCTTYIPADRYAYVYVEFKDGVQSLKIYQPFNQRYKWISDGNNSVWSLWDQLPESGDKLIITSSLKDSLCLWANLDIPSCSLQSEVVIPKQQVINQLKERFKQIYILYDNDYTKLQNTGQIHAQKLAEKYELINICIDEQWETKDPSDFYKKHGKQQFINYFYGKFHKFRTED